MNLIAQIFEILLIQMHAANAMNNGIRYYC